MKYNTYKKLLKNVGARAFLVKPYGLELLFILERCERENADNGIEDSYEMLSHFKPRRAAFSNYIQSLEVNKHIVKSSSVLKASKSVLRTSEDVGKVFKAFIEGVS